MLLELDFKKRNLTVLCTILFGLIVSGFVIHSPLYLAILLGCISFLITGTRPTVVYANVITLRRDVTAAVRFLRLSFILYIWEKKGLTVPMVFRNIVKKHPYKMAFTMDDTQLAFQDVEDFSNKIASYFKSKGFVRGDTIALLMETRVQYPPIWLGLSKIGVVGALINWNLRKETLLHSINVANSKGIIVGSELVEALNDIRNAEGVKGIPVFQYCDMEEKEENNPSLMEGAIDLEEELREHVTTDVTGDILKGSPKDKMVYIYTSGTTGLPKAAVITHLRYMFMCLGSSLMLGISEDDIIYNPLPLYHTAGGMLGVGNVFIRGISMIFRKRFSASNFWADCVKYNCTVAQYIGELCRYLLSVPPKPLDTRHNIRMMFGNGLRPQIWSQFVSRFNIEQIGELYGSTEGNSNLVNNDNQIGAIGFVPLAAGKLYPVALIKCDEDTGDPIRDESGRCIRCLPGEPGVFIGKINPKRAINSFSGYADKKASEKKIIRDVFKVGDMYFNSGDILVGDILGYFYFKDRTGDTYRWRGENVATSEVEAVISNVLGLKDCVVYGVEVPHVEGKAGMAAIVDPNKTVDMDHFSIGIRGSLPPFARPIFIRVLKELPMTGTFKLKKRDLQNEGFDINKIKDPLYFLNSDGTYREFSQKDFDDVMNGRARL